MLRPGIYQLPLGSRVQDAILAAGGFPNRAAENTINLPVRLEDGEQITVLASAPTPAPGNPDTNSPPPTAQPGAPQTLPGTSGELVNINTATLEELVALPEIGPVTAQKIIDYRVAHGQFQTIEEIMEVNGIGPATFDSIKDLITVTGQP